LQGVAFHAIPKLHLTAWHMRLYLMSRIVVAVYRALIPHI